MKKQIISATKNYEPSTVDELLLDDTPKVNSFNFVTSDGIARAIAGTSGEVPVVTEGDNGKILTAIYDEGGAAVEWADAPQELPSTLGTAGQVLTVNDGATGVEWADPASYTFSHPIIETSGVVSLGFDSNTLSASAAAEGTVGSFSLITATVGADAKLFGSVSGTGLDQALNSGSPYNEVTFHIPGDAFYDFSFDPDRHDYYLQLGIDATLADSTDATICLVPLTRTEVYNSQVGSNIYVVDEQDVTVSLPLTQNSNWSTPNFTFGSGVYMNIVRYYGINSPYAPIGPVSTYVCRTLDASAGVTATAELPASPLTVKNPVPTPTSGDAAKVLTVTDTQGNYGWVPVPQELPPIATNAGKVLAVNSGATGTEWTNFTQIEVVASMPADPVSGVLYIVTGA